MDKSLRIAVVGAGLMGHGIAQVFAAYGCAVRISDIGPALASVRDRVRANLAELRQDQAVADRIEPCTTLEKTVEGADFIVEAATEDLASKRALFVAMEEAVSDKAVLASNTSALPIGSIMRDLRDPSRCIGTHWWNPPHLMPLVEVVGTDQTRPEILQWTLALHRALGKTVVHVRRDVPGFIGNRLQSALWREAISLVEHGICDASDVDIVVKASFGRRLAVLGPLENADLVGTDLTLAVHETVLPSIEASSSPSRYLRSLVDGGRLGVRSGHGFHRWTPETVANLRRALNAHLIAAGDHEGR